MRDTVPVVLLASTQHWRSPFQIGTHHIARQFARRGYRVGFLSAPLSPLHLLPGIGSDKRARFASMLRGGEVDSDNGVWHAVPFALLSSAPAPVLGSAWAVRNAWRTCVPSLRRLLRRGGFERPDAVLTDHFLHGIGLEQVDCALRVHRVADRSSAFPGASPAFGAFENAFLRRCDLVVTSSVDLHDGLREAGIDALLIENGVEIEHFRRPLAKPVEYAAVAGPIAVYVGATEPWVDLGLIVASASMNPSTSFFVIGPRPGTMAVAQPANLHWLGPRSRDVLPAYLQHAQVGLIPFHLSEHRALLRGVNPLKLYEYAAAGLPVVSTPIPGAGAAQSLAAIADTRDRFVACVSQALARPVRTDSALDAFDWSARLRPLFERIEALPAVRSPA